MGHRQHAVRSDVRALSPRGSRTLICGVGFGLSLAVCAAVPAPPASAPIPDYEDRLIEGLPPAAVDAGDDVPFDASGWPRTWRVEAIASRLDQAARIASENGLRLSGRLDTPHHGAFTLDGTLRTRPGTGVFTLWQRAVPFDGGWSANSGIGILNTASIDLSRYQYRFYLPSFPIRGASTEWLHDPDLQLQFGFGEPGVFDGLRLQGFAPRRGSLATGGVQWNPSREWQIGIQFAEARDVDAAANGAGIVLPATARSATAMLAWQGSNTRVQANLIGSDAAGGARGTGAWVDASTHVERYRHHYGAFRLDPDLVWGYTPVSSDIEGGYYRLRYQDRRWQWDAGFDAVNSVSGRGVSGVYGVGSLRYQVDRSLGIGGGATYRHTDGNAGTAYGFVETTGATGFTRVQLDTSYDEQSRRNVQVNVDHTWPTAVGSRLLTSLSVGRETGPGTRIDRVSTAVVGGSDLSGTLSVEGNLRHTWARDAGTGSATGINADVSLNWRLGPRWSLVATYYDHRDDTPPPLAIDSVIPPQAPVAVPRTRALFVTLRFEDRAGLPSLPLGGVPGGRAGNIVGYVYLDANDSGQRDAADPPAPGVTVVLDGRFAARTDAQGRFEFPLVAAGAHSVVVIPDNLPLPWSIDNNGRRELTVGTRETATLDIGATRIK